MTTIRSDVTKIWKVVHNLLGTIITIPGTMDDDNKQDGVHPLACVNNKGTLAAVYKGKLHFTIYDLKEKDETFKKKDVINLRREIIANGINDFNYTPQRDEVSRIRFMGGD